MEDQAKEDLELVRALADKVVAYGDLWLHTPLAEWSGATPRDMVLRGDTRHVIAWLAERLP